MMFSRNVFWGATNPRRPPGIVTSLLRRWRHLSKTILWIFTLYCFQSGNIAILSQSNDILVQCCNVAPVKSQDALSKDALLQHLTEHMLCLIRKRPIIYRCVCVCVWRLGVVHLGDQWGAISRSRGADRRRRRCTRVALPTWRAPAKVWQQWQHRHFGPPWQREQQRSDGAAVVCNGKTPLRTFGIYTFHKVCAEIEVGNGNDSSRLQSFVRQTFIIWEQIHWRMNCF